MRTDTMPEPPIPKPKPPLHPCVSCGTPTEYVECPLCSPFSYPLGWWYGPHSGGVPTS